MTSPITPDPALHHDPTAKQSDQQQLQAAERALQQMFSQIIPQIVQLVVNAILNGAGLSSIITPGLGLGNITKDLENLLSPLTNLMGNYPAAKITGTTAGLQQLIDGVVGGSSNPLTSLINAVLGGIGTIDPTRLPFIPLSAIGSGNPTPNLVLSGDFPSANVLSGQNLWSWDGLNGHTTAGSATTTANGSQLTLLSNLIGVAPNQVVDLSGWTQWSNLVATGNPITLSVQTYLNGVFQATQTIASIASPGASGTWQQLTGSYTVPSSGVDNIRLALGVGPTATAGNVWFDDLSATKAGLLSNNWMNGLTSGNNIGQDMQLIVDHVINGITGGATSGNPIATVLSTFQGFFTGTGSWPTLLTNLFGNNAIGTILQLPAIPGLPASQVTSGTFANTLIPDITRAMSTDLQSVIDNVQQAINGGTSTGNAASTVKANLQSLMTNLFGTNVLGTVLQAPAIPNITRAMSSDLQSTIDELLQGYTGTTTTGNSPSALNTSVGASINSRITALEGGGVLTQYTTSGTWTKPTLGSDGIAFGPDELFTIVCICGGDGGSTAPATPDNAKGGVSGGYVSQRIKYSALASSYAMTIGAGGSSGGGTGGTTSFGSLVVGSPGLGGEFREDGSFAVVTPPGDGGDGATYDPASLGTGINSPSTNGKSSSFAVGGKAGVGTSTAGSGGSAPAGVPSGGGGGGGGSVTSTNAGAGGTGGFPGGGGGGSGSYGNVRPAGAAGAAGCIYVTAPH